MAGNPRPSGRKEPYQVAHAAQCAVSIGAGGHFRGHLREERHIRAHLHMRHATTSEIEQRRSAIEGSCERPHLVREERGGGRGEGRGGGGEEDAAEEREESGRGGRRDRLVAEGEKRGAPRPRPAGAGGGGRHRPPGSRWAWVWSENGVTVWALGKQASNRCSKQKTNLGLLRP
jgi:hypothetical protein